MKITATDEDEKNFHLISINIKSNLSIQDDGELFLSKKYHTSDGINSNRVIIITDINSSIEKDDWFTLHGEIHRCHSEMDIKQLSREHEVTRKIISSNSPMLTPSHLISDYDLQYIVEYWNKYKNLPDGELEENHFVKGQPRTLGTNEVIINWDKEIEAMNYVAEVCDKTPRSKASNSIRDSLNLDTDNIHPEAGRVRELLTELRSYRDKYKHGSPERFEYNGVCDKLDCLASHLLNGF